MIRKTDSFIVKFTNETKMKKCPIQNQTNL